MLLELRPPLRAILMRILPVLTLLAAVPHAKAQCSYTVGPTAFVIGASGGSSPVSVSTNAICPWVASSGSAWLSVNPSNFLGSGPAVVTAQPNTGPQRVGTVTIAGRTVSVTQLSGCTYTLSTTTVNVTDSGASQFSVGVTTAAGCPITTTSNAAWLTVIFQSTSVAVSVAANTGPARTGTLTIAGQTVTVNQVSGCTYSLSATSFNAGLAGGQFTVNVTRGAGCPLTVFSAAPWITLGAQAATVTITVAANAGPARTGTVTIAGQTVTISQSSGCTYSFSPTSISVPSAGDQFTTTVSTGVGCPIFVTHSLDWVTTITESNAVTITVLANTGPARSGPVTIAGQTLTINQAAGTCTFTLSATTINAPAGGGAFNITVTTQSGCTWTANTQSVAWLGTVVTTSNAVAINIPANSGPPRSGAITVAGQSVAINQAGNCTAVVSPSSFNLQPAGQEFSFDVKATAGCNWQAVNSILPDSVTLQLVSGSPGAGDGRVTYRTGANIGAQTASYSISIVTTGASPATLATVSVSQASNCLSTSFSSDFLNAGPGATTTSIGVSANPGCIWEAVPSSSPWLTVPNGRFNGAGPGSVPLTLAATSVPSNATLNLRLGAFVYDSATIARIACTYSAAGPTTFSVGGVESEIDALLTASPGPGCIPPFSTASSWIQLIRAVGGEKASAEIRILANTGAARRGSFSLGGQTFTVDQAAAGNTCPTSVSPTRSSISSAATSLNFTITAAPACAWQVNPSDSWLRVASGASGTGNGTVSVDVGANSTTATRTGSLRIGDLTVPITQASSCEYELPSGPSTLGAGGGATFITVGTRDGCPWTPISNSDWIRLRDTSPRSGPGVITFDFADSPVPRSGSIFVAGRSIAFNQVPCGVTAATNSLDVGGVGGNVTFNLSQIPLVGCTQVVLSNPPWVSRLTYILQGGPPHVSVFNTFIVAPNPGAARSGQIRFHNGPHSPEITLTINQGASGSESCAYTFNPVRTRIGLGGGASPVDVETNANCVWTPSSAISWLTLNNSNSIARTGPARFFFSTAPSSQARSGSLQVGGAIHLVDQIPCNFSVTPLPFAEGAVIGGSGGSAFFRVSRAVDRGCDVIVDRFQVPWILSHSVGIDSDGTATVQFIVASNPGPERSGVVQIAGIPVTIRQHPGTACTYTVSPSSFTIGTGGGEVSIQVATSLFCPAPVVNNTNFVYLWAVTPSSAAQVGGPQTLTFLVDSSAGPRSGSIAIGGQTITINQVACSFLNVQPSQPTVGEAGGTITLTGVQSSPALGCPAPAISEAPWLTVLSTNRSPLNANTNAFTASVQVAPWAGQPRVGTVRVGPFPFAVNQLACAYNLAPSQQSINIPAAGGDRQINTSPAAQFGCSPAYQTTTPWITILGFDGARLNVRLAPNDGAPRTGTISFAGTTINVNQGPLCTFNVTPNPVANIPAAGGALSLNVNTASYCPWSGQSLTPWITPTGTGSRTGTGSITLTAAPNTGASRSAVYRIVDQDIPISQLASNAGACTYSLNPSSANFNQNGGNGSFTISGAPANCQGTWEALATSSWITLQSPSSGAGPGPATVNYVVSANGAGGQRTSLITAGGAAHSITQGALAGEISALPTSLLFLATLNNPPPNPQLINLAFSAGAAELQVTSGVAWLSGLPAQLRTPANLQVSVQPVGLAAGVYRSSLTVTQAGSTQSITIPVELRVAAQANSGLALPAVTRFRWRVGDPPPPPQSVTLFSRPSAQAFAQPQGVPAWLQVTAEGEAAPLQYSLRLRPELLAPQSEPHRATIAFPLRNAAESRTEIVVEALVQARQSGRLVALRNDYTVELPPGGRPASGAGDLEVGLANVGAESLNYTVQTQADSVLEVVRGGEGSIAPGRRAWLRARVRGGGLEPGSYPEQIRIFPSAGDPVNVDVVVLVPRPDKVLFLSRSALVFKATSNDRDLEPASFFIRNLGAGSLPWTMQVDQSASLSTWLQIVGEQTQGTAAPDSEVQVLVNPAGLPAGRHQGIIRVRAPGAANAEQTLLVVLEIVADAESSAADISPSALALPAVQGGTAVSQTLTLRNRKAAPLNFTAVFTTHNGGAWLSGDRQGTVPANGSLAYRLALAPGANTPGVYRGAVRFDFGRGVIEQVNVAMVVSPSGTILPRAVSAEPAPRENACVPSEAVAVLSSQGLTGRLRPGSPIAFSAQIRDNCGQPISNRALLGNGVQIQIGGAGIPLHPQSAGWWSGEWTPLTSTVLETEIQAVIEGPEDTFNAGPGLRLATLTQSSNSAAEPALAAILNAASFTRNGRVTPGSLVTLFGTNLATREEAIGTSVPFSLAGSRVLLGNRALPLFYAGPGQINAALPHDLNPGEQIQVRVESGAASSLPASLTIEDQAPGIFVQAFPGRNQGAVLVAGTVFVAGPSNLGGAYRPIRRGEFLQIFATGLGAVSNPPGLGDLAGVPLSLVSAETKVLLGGRELTPAFSGLAPGFIGLYQMNVQVPEDFASTGDATLQLRVGARLSNEVVVAIE